MKPPDTYTPQPLDTSSVELPAAVEELMELLARHNHDVWAQGRIREQWKWGSHRDDLAKTHPTLVPYECLSESEKEYDRESARESLKAIRYFGYVIHRADPSVASDDGPVATSPEQLRADVAALRDQDEPLLAYDALVKGLVRPPPPVSTRSIVFPASRRKDYGVFRMYRLAASQPA